LKFVNTKGDAGATNRITNNAIAVPVLCRLTSMLKEFVMLEIVLRGPAVFAGAAVELARR
jgi:hypothetical protein